MSSPYRTGEDLTPYQLGALRSAHAERTGCVLRVIAGVLVAFLVAMTFINGVPVSTAMEMAVVIAIGVFALWRMGRRNPRGLILLYERGLTSNKHGRPRVIRF